ncbi:MAG: polysulfide reductase NrfD [Acidobacteriota bacterium]|nr:MAG: polysulfide reductase NrfD [Acidobacteriota bacterium]
MEASRRDKQIEDALLRHVVETGSGFYIVLVTLLAIIAVGGFAWMRQLEGGLGVAGMNQPVYWGLYITNYIFFIGISHAGTLISAILRLTGAEWRRPITRVAEVITVVALLMGSSNILWHLGRPELLYLPMLKPQFLSPLIWDVGAISLYISGSIVYLYLPLIPDLALLRDRSTRFKGIYRALALGWSGTERQHARLEKAISFMAVAIIPVAVSVHTVVSWTLAMMLVPMWHTAIFGPYFVVGAIFSGIAALLVAMAILRRVFHLEEYIGPLQFNNLSLLLVTMSCLWAYFTLAEHLTAWYGNEHAEMAVLDSRLSGAFAPYFWTMIVACFVIPMTILSFKKTRTIRGSVIASISVLVGMWLERFIIVISSASHPRSQQMWDAGTYTPSFVEIAITVSEFAAFILFYVVFAKLFPLVSIWEVKEAPPEESPAAETVAEA